MRKYYCSCPSVVYTRCTPLSPSSSRSAVAFFERAFAQNPLAETAWLLGDARERRGDPDGAQRAYADAEREGRRSDRRTLALMFATQNRNVDEAVTLAQRERSVRADIYTDDALAFALYRAGRVVEAKTAIERARRLGTPDARLLFHEGLIRSGLGETRAAKRLLERALNLNAHFDERGAREAAVLLGRSS